MAFAPQYTPRGPEYIMQGAMAMGQGINQGLQSLGQGLQRMKEEKKEADAMRGWLKSAMGQDKQAPGYTEMIDKLTLPKLRERYAEARAQIDTEQRELENKKVQAQLDAFSEQLGSRRKQQAAMDALVAMMQAPGGQPLPGFAGAVPEGPNRQALAAQMFQAGFDPRQVADYLDVAQNGGEGPASIRELVPGLSVVEKPGSRAFQVIQSPGQSQAMPIAGPDGRPIAVAAGSRVIPLPDAPGPADVERARQLAQETLAAAEKAASQAYTRRETLLAELASGKGINGKPMTEEYRATLVDRIAKQDEAVDHWNARVIELRSQAVGEQKKGKKADFFFDKSGNPKK